MWWYHTSIRGAYWKQAQFLSCLCKFKYVLYCFRYTCFFSISVPYWNVCIAICAKYGCIYISTWKNSFFFLIPRSSRTDPSVSSGWPKLCRDEYIRIKAWVCLQLVKMFSKKLRSLNFLQNLGSFLIWMISSSLFLHSTFFRLSPHFLYF